VHPRRSHDAASAHWFTRATALATLLLIVAVVAYLLLSG
jgi:hypothetical protein